ncbi:MAG TPA: phosphate-starvation-inducible PsiE family protein [Pseudolabrys sp.]|nr:phosphate-starvation-inducible PsiE family protein [Pseudolabrys sp.]
MLNIDALRKEWKSLTSYERFEQIVSRIIMLFISVVIVYSLCLAAIELVKDSSLGVAFMGPELLQDIFGSLLTVLILLEFNHSIASSLNKRSGVLQARVVVLIAIIVVARKIILLDFKTATIEQFGAIAGMALALGLLYWLLGAENFKLRALITPPPKAE